MNEHDMGMSHHHTFRIADVLVASALSLSPALAAPKMLARYPRRFLKGLTVDEMVLNIDLAPTFLDLAGVPVPAETQGASWKDVATGQKQPNWRTSFVMYYEKELGDTPTCVGIRTTDRKYIRYLGHPEWNEAFDLAEDPLRDEGPRQQSDR